MPLQIVTIPCLSDNYAYLLHDAPSGDTTLIDAPEAAPILSALETRGWRLSQVLLTHHHFDHVDGLPAILNAHPARVLGAAADAHRLPTLARQLREGDQINVGGENGTVIEVPGHTIGHIAFHFPESKAVFTADSLMALGCGRLFEGSAEMMWASLSKLAALPRDTRIYSGHEYTQANAKFALTIEPGNSALISRSEQINAARADGRPTVPSALSTELDTNPFLRAHLPALKATLGMAGATDAETFAEIRARKDSF